MAILGSGSGAAKGPSLADPQIAMPKLGPGVRPTMRGLPPINTTFFAGFAAFQTSSSSASVTFKVPKPTCTATDSAMAPGAFVQESSSFDGAGMLVQCLSGSISLVPAIVIGGVTNHFSDTVRVGDTITASVSVGPSGTSATVQDLTSPRNFTQTLTGSDTAPVDELLGVDAVVDSMNNQLPVPAFGSVRFTSSTVGGSSLGSTTPRKLVWVNGCPVVLQPGGIDATGMIFAVAPPKLNVSSLNPTVATTGTNIEIDGSGFTSSTTVTFGGGISATTVTHDSAAVMHAVVPTQAITGPIQLKNPGSVTTGCTFGVAPKITSVVPTSARTGQTVVINGSGLKPSERVTFNGKLAKVSSASAVQLKAIVPNGATTGALTVTTPSGSASATPFTITFSITSINPASGPHGTVVVINGVGFNSSSTVKFNGVAATTVTHVSGTQLKATVPPTATTGPLTVTNTSAPAGTIQSPKSYTLTADVAPTVTSFSPTSGAVGTPVTITGTHFSGASAIKFGTVKATFKIVSDTEITTTVPTGAVTAPISVTNAIGTGTSATSFMVT